VGSRVAGIHVGSILVHRWPNSATGEHMCCATGQNNPPTFNISNVSPQLNNISQPYSAPMTYSVRDDWSQILDMTERLVNLMGQPGNVLAILEGPLNMVSSMNFSRIGEAMMVVGDLMKGGSVNDMAR